MVSLLVIFITSYSCSHYFNVLFSYFLFNDHDIVFSCPFDFLSFSSFCTYSSFLFFLSFLPLYIFSLLSHFVFFLVRLIIFSIFLNCLLFLFSLFSFTFLFILLFHLPIFLPHLSPALSAYLTTFCLLCLPFSVVSPSYLFLPVITSFHFLSVLSRSSFSFTFVLLHNFLCPSFITLLLIFFSTLSLCITSSLCSLTLLTKSYVNIFAFAFF